MKIKFTDKLLLFVGSIFMVVVGAAILLASLQFNAIPIRAEGEGFLTLTRFALLFSGLVVMAFGVFCLSLPGKIKQTKLEFITQKTDTGELKISTQAVEAIVQKNLFNQDAVKLQSFIVQAVKGGVELNLHVSLANNINIPGAVNEIRRNIAKTLKDTLNIEAKEIKITIEDANLTSVRSPHRVSEDKLILPVEPETKNHNTNGQSENK